MKKKYLTIIIMMIALLCTACNMGKTEQIGYDIEALYNTDESYQAQPYWGNASTIKKLGSTYYFADSHKLYYWDSVSKQGGIVCSAANCEHTDSSCNGCFGTYGKNYNQGFYDLGLEIYNNKIIKVGYELDDVMDFYLYAVGLDGSERMQTGYLYSMEIDADGGVSWWYDMVMIDGYYYGWLNQTSNQEECVVGLYKIRLDGEYSLVYDMSDTGAVWLGTVSGVGDCVSFTVEWDESDNNSYTQALMLYNTKTEQVSLIAHDLGLVDYCFIDYDSFVYWDMNGNCFLVNTDTGESICFAEKLEDVMAISSDGTYIYLEVLEEDTLILVYDLQGNMVDEIVYKSGDLLFGDESYMFIISPFQPDSDEYEEYLKSMNLSKDDSFPMPEYSYLWILDKSQLGNETKEWMKMELE